MPLTEQLLQIFFDQFVASLIVPVNAAYILDVVRELNPERFAIGSIVAIFGNIAGGCVSYLFGHIIANSFFKVEKTNTINHKYQKFYLFMLLTPMNYFGSVITFLAGFGHMNKKRFFIILSCVNATYFLAQILLYFVLA